MRPGAGAPDSHGPTGSARSRSRRERMRQVVAYYRTVSRHIDRELEEREDLGFWRHVADQHRGEDVLELGAGTGRVTRFLLPPARRVLALDLSPHMLRRARRRLAGRRGVHLIRADVTRIPLRSGFHLAVAANGVFSHLLEDDERSRALKDVSSLLRPGGRLLVDALWFPSEERRKLCRGDGRTRQRTVGEGEERMEIRERWECDGRTRRCTARYEYRLPDGRVERAESRVRYWSYDELEERLQAAGFRLTRAWGGYRGEEWDPESSRVLVADARRRE